MPLLTAGMITPGYIFLLVMSRFTTMRPDFVSSLALSGIYYALFWAFTGSSPLLSIWQGAGRFDISWLVAMIVVLAPAGGGLVLAVLFRLTVQRKFFYYVLQFVKLKPAYRIPSAWGWKFMQADQQWITVHLKDGRDIPALYGKNFFVSTDPNERDLYLSNVYTWGGDGCPVEDERVKGLLLKANSIDRIEFHASKPTCKNSKE